MASSQPSTAAETPPGRAVVPAPAAAPSRIKWDRVGRIALVLVLFAVAYSYLNPAIDLFKTYQSTTAAKAEFHALLRENKRLHQADPDGRRAAPWSRAPRASRA